MIPIVIWTIKENTCGHENFYLLYFWVTLFLYIVPEVIKTGVVVLHQFFNAKCIKGGHVVTYSIPRLPVMNGWLEIPSTTDE